MRLSLFWRFQLGGWLAFTVFSFPLKWILLYNAPGSFMGSLYRDGLGFLLTIGMREIYRRVYREDMPKLGFALLLIVVPSIGGLVLTLFSLAVQGMFTFEEEKIFNNGVLLGIFYFRTVLCLCWSLLYFGIKLLLQDQERKRRLVLIESEKKEAELQMLKAQMNPHFLFNALNTIRAGAQTDDLWRTIQAFTNCLRYALESSKTDLVPLGKEFDVLQDYLTVEQARFEDRLEFGCRIDDGAREIPVPGIILQPLVENAVKHGLDTSPRPLRILLNIAGPENGYLTIEVANTGHWVDPKETEGPGGLGLKNTHRRLDIFYGGKYSLEVVHADGWVRIRLRLPVS